MAEKDLDPENIRISKEKDFKISFTVDAETGGCNWEIKNLPGSKLGHGCAPVSKDIEDELGAHPVTRITTSEFEEVETQQEKTSTGAPIFAVRPRVVGFEPPVSTEEEKEKKKIKVKKKRKIEEDQ